MGTVNYHKAEDFRGYKDKEPFEEMMHRLNRSELSQEDLEYIKKESESWEEVLRFGMEHYEEGIKEGLKEGLKEGEAKGKIDIAKNLLSLGVDVQTIIKATGLDEKAISSLK